MNHHSLTIGTKNTWDDWKLVAEDRPVISPPQAKTLFLDIPGMNGSLDISEALTGYPLFENRTGSLEFIVLNSLDYDKYTSYQHIYEGLAKYIHNKNLRMVMEDEPDFFYEGRFYFKDWKSDHPRSKVVIDYELKPYKKFITAVDEPWLWNPFSFVNGVITTGTFSSIKVESTTNWKTIELNRFLYGDEPISPLFIVSGDVTVHFVSEELNTDFTTTLTTGNTKVPEIMFAGEECKIEFKGNGVVTMSFYKGKL